MDLNTAPKPWYREIWFWLLVSPMLTLVVSVPVMLTTAFKNADDRVLDNYYKEGRMINHRFEEQSLAVDLGMGGVLEFDWLAGSLWFKSNRPVMADALQVYFSHPALSERDFTLTLKRVSDQNFRVDLTAIERGRWYISLQGEIEASETKKAWRIPSDIDLSEANNSNITQIDIVATPH